MNDDDLTLRAPMTTRIALAERIGSAAQIVLEYGGAGFALDRAERNVMLAALRSNELQANINRGLSLVADLEAAGTIDAAVSAELQIALGGSYQPREAAVSQTEVLPDWDDLRGCLCTAVQRKKHD